MIDADKAAVREAKIDIHIVMRPPKVQQIGSTDEMSQKAQVLRDEIIEFLRLRVQAGGYTLQVRDTHRVI